MVTTTCDHGHTRGKSRDQFCLVTRQNLPRASRGKKCLVTRQKMPRASCLFGAPIALSSSAAPPTAPGGELGLLSNPLLNCRGLGDSRMPSKRPCGRGGRYPAERPSANAFDGRRPGRNPGRRPAGRPSGVDGRRTGRLPGRVDGRPARRPVGACLFTSWGCRSWRSGRAPLSAGLWKGRPDCH